MVPIAGETTEASVELQKRIARTEEVAFHQFQPPEKEGWAH
jgi:hypothetical protein